MFKMIIIFLTMQKNHFSSFLEFFLFSPLLALVKILHITNYLHNKSHKYFEQYAKNCITKALIEDEIYWIEFEKVSMLILVHSQNLVSSSDIKDSMAILTSLNPLLFIFSSSQNIIFTARGLYSWYFFIVLRK